MAKIYFSYVSEDAEYVQGLIRELGPEGHEFVGIGTLGFVASDSNPMPATVLKSIDLIVFVISANSFQNLTITRECAVASGFARANGTPAIISILLDSKSPPGTLAGYHAFHADRKSLGAVVASIRDNAGMMDGSRAALESRERVTEARIQENATEFIKEALVSLEVVEARDRWFANVWHWLGFACLFGGVLVVALAVYFGQQAANSSIEGVILGALKLFFLLGLLGACAKYSFVLGKSYSGEARKSSDRMHAIRFGKFYLNVFKGEIKWAEIKEVFQHWNIDRNSSFSELDASQFDPKIIETLTDFARVVVGKKDDKKD